MPGYAITLLPAAIRALKKIKDAAIRRRLGHAIDVLKSQPRPSGAKALQGASGVLRGRVGDYRILYTIDDAVLTVLVVAIGNRRDL